MVYVISKDGKPLMPTKRHGKIAYLLKNGLAKVVKRKPFTIQLFNDTKGYTQKVTLGIDPGYKHIGFSAITDEEELISGEIKLDNMMSKRLQDKSMYRKHKRNRLWYREPRFMNRISTKKKGWLAPSVQRRLDTHVSLVNKIKEILPIAKIILEVANFDIQQINKPDIEGKEYQQGSLYQYANMKSYLIARENSKCQLCGKEKGKDVWNVHHIISRTDGGTNKPNNLALLHKKCHEDLHKQELGNQLKKNKQYKAATFMNIIRWKLRDALYCAVTFGHLTHQKILTQELTKTHINDAFVIANGTTQSRTKPFEVIQKRKNNRCLQKNRNGFKPSIRRQRYSLQPKDLVKIKNKVYTVIGIHCYGRSIYLKDTLGNKINKGIKKLDNWKYHSKTLAWCT